MKTAGRVSSLFCIACLLFYASFSRAQSVDTVHKFETEEHYQPPENALVGITVVNHSVDGSSQTRHGNGLFIRCDGFVLAPDSLFAAANSANPLKPDQTVTIVLYPGTDHEKAIPARRPREFGTLSSGDRWVRIPYAVIKIDDIHFPASRLLAPAAVSPGDSLRVIYSAWNEEKRRFQPVQTISTAAAEGAKTARSLLPSNSKSRFEAEISGFAQPLGPPSPVAGAIVCGPKDFAVGIVANPDSAGSYINFDALDQVSNCISPPPTTEEQFAALLKSAAESVAPGADPPFRSRSDMVHVVGGPLKIPSVVKGYEADMENVYEACIGPFDIDRFEVTNQQYLEFWRSLSESARKDIHTVAAIYPLGWGDPSSPFPAALAEVPVLGVRVSGAQAYAKWAGKRLATPYEWCLAAFGRYGGNRPPEWADKYMRARQAAWDRIVQEHLAYARQHPEILPGFSIRTDITGAVSETADWSRPVVEEFLQLPWFFTRPGYADACAWSHACVKQACDSLFKEWVDPGYVLPVGSRPYDVSPCGAADMIMNARELVLPGPHGLWKKIPNENWTYQGVDRYMQVDWVQGGLIGRQWFMAATSLWDVGLPKAAEKQIMLDPLTAVVNLDSILQTAGFMNNNLLISHPAHAVLTNVATVLMNQGVPFGGSKMPLNSLDTPVPAEQDGRLLGLYHPVQSYEFRMPSRRIRSAAQNAGPGSVVPADLGDYVAVCSALQEYAEQLRPVNTCMLNLVAGPGYDNVYWASSGTWGITDYFMINGPTSQQRVGKVIVRNPIGDLGVNEWWADGTCIRMTGAFADWSAGPDHYHQELGRQTAIDARYPLNSRDSSTVIPHRYSPDSYLIPGGFRCAR